MVLGVEISGSAEVSRRPEEEHSALASMVWLYGQITMKGTKLQLCEALLSDMPCSDKFGTVYPGQ